MGEGNVEKMLLPTADVTDGCQAGISRTVINKEDARGNGSLTEKVSQLTFQTWHIVDFVVYGYNDREVIVGGGIFHVFFFLLLQGP